MSDHDQSTPLEPVREEMRAIAREIRAGHLLIRERLKRLAERLSPSADIELMREGLIPWELESQLYQTVEALAEEGGLQACDDPARHLEEDAGLMPETLHHEFVEAAWAAYLRRYPNAVRP